MATCKEIIKTIEQFAPMALAEDWDNVGLQVGDPCRDIKSILVTLDVTSEVLEEAVGLGVDMIVSHHPLIFKPQKNITRDDPVGKLLFQAIRKNIDIYVCHTNADSSRQGVSHCLAQSLGLEDIQVLQPAGTQLYKLVVFVPEGYESQVRDAMGDAGAGWLGQYSHCSFSSPGTGSFKPLSGAKPFIGSQGKLEEVSELRIETIVPQYILRETIKRVLQVHPYEEVAYDVYPLENVEQRHGLGRIGNLRTPMTLRSLGEKVKNELNCPWVALSGDETKVVQRIAVCGGSGGNLVRLAHRKHADVLVTGDVKYHDALEGKQLGIGIIDAGHNATERILVLHLVQYLTTQLNTGGENIKVYASETETNPWTLVIG